MGSDDAIGASDELVVRNEPSAFAVGSKPDFGVVIYLCSQKLQLTNDGCTVTRSTWLRR